MSFDVEEKVSQLDVHERIKSLVFESKKIGGRMIKNSLVRLATHEGMASVNGSVTDELVGLYRTIAEGGAGLIITGYAYVQLSGKSAPLMTGIDKDEQILGLRRIAETVHKHGDGCKIAIQIEHCGRQSLIPKDTIAPSAILEPMTNKMPREMTIEEIEDTIEAFAEAARRAKEAGFDAVQLSAAGGYLLSGFLSPHTNKRTDEYGGNTEKRIKIVEDIFDRAINKVGKNFPILIKANVDDFLEDGINLTESKKIAKEFSRIGFAAYETSGSMWETATRTEEELGWTPVFPPNSRINIGSKDKEAYALSYAREIKKVIDIPLILGGGIRSLDIMGGILKEGRSADLIGLCRPLIRQPDLPNRWLKEIGGLTADCISCNGCADSLRVGAIRCTQKENN
jgi:2,4-dienoyl-CoA reductase-like NADH-dependent reductase (Old Yellow Enzyme family)